MSPKKFHRSSPQRLPTALPLTALTVLVVACGVGSGATAAPTVADTQTPGVTQAPATPSPTASPTATPTLAAELIQHPTGATDVVLRMEQGGGFVPMNFFVTQAPQFTLYGDGTVVFQQIDNRENAFDQAKLPWLTAKLDEESVQALLQFALSTGRLANAKDSYDNPMIADAGSTIFNLNAAGLEKVVNVYALMESAEPGPDAADRNGFAQLAAVLNNFQNQAELGDVTEYEPQFYRVVLLEGFGQPTGPVVEWPWDDLTVADFPAGDEPGGIKILDADHVAQLMDVPNGGHIGVWAHDPDGNLIQLAVRPLLPDENPES